MASGLFVTTVGSHSLRLEGRRQSVQARLSGQSRTFECFRARRMLSGQAATRTRAEKSPTWRIAFSPLVTKLKSDSIGALSSPPVETPPPPSCCDLADRLSP